MIGTTNSGQFMSFPFGLRQRSCSISRARRLFELVT